MVIATPAAGLIPSIAFEPGDASVRICRLKLGKS
jgi:hypothetical protein